MNDVTAAIQRAILAQRRLAAIQQCAETTGLVRYLDARTGPVRCELLANHDAATPHRARLGGAQRVEWLGTKLTLVIR